MIDATGNTRHRDSLNQLQWGKFAGRRLCRDWPGAAHRNDNDCGENESEHDATFCHILPFEKSTRSTVT
jgi:hypothetical protein